jgi:hypothetical protein
MYTGTLIRDLIATVERVEQRAQLRQIVDEMDLQIMFELQVGQIDSEPVFAGAA